MPATSRFTMDRGADAELTDAQLLREIGRRHARAQRAIIAQHDIPASHCTVLTELGRASDGVSVSTLAARLKIDKGWVSRVTQQMIADGYLERDPNVDDQRVVSLRVTRPGRALHRRTERLLDEQMNRVLAAAGSRGARSARAFLDRLADAYQAELASHEATSSS